MHLAWLAAGFQSDPTTVIPCSDAAAPEEGREAAMVPCPLPFTWVFYLFSPGEQLEPPGLPFSAAFTSMKWGLSRCLSRVGKLQPSCKWLNNIDPAGFLEIFGDHILVLAVSECKTNKQKSKDLGKGIFRLFRHAT